MNDFFALVRKTLMARMYTSVDRMNQAVIDGDTKCVDAERRLQQNLRRMFPCPR